MAEENLITLREAAALPFVVKHKITKHRMWWWTRLDSSGNETSNPKRAVLRTINIGTGKKNRWLRTKVKWVKQALVDIGVAEDASEL